MLLGPILTLTSAFFKLILQTDILSTSWIQISQRWVPQNPNDVTVIAWCCEATGHHLSHCWPRSISPRAGVKYSPSPKIHHFQSSTNTNTLLFLYNSNTLSERNQIQIRIWPQAWLLPYGVTRPHCTISQSPRPSAYTIETQSYGTTPVSDKYNLKWEMTGRNKSPS